MQPYLEMCLAGSLLHANLTPELKLALSHDDKIPELELKLKHRQGTI